MVYRKIAFTDLYKERNGELRADALLRLIDSRSPVMIDGEPKYLSFASGDIMEAYRRHEFTALKRPGTLINLEAFIDTDGRSYRITDIDKSQFPGRPPVNTEAKEALHARRIAEELGGRAYVRPSECTDESWNSSANRIARKLRSLLPGSYDVHHRSDQVREIKRKFERLNDGRFSHVDKWNPSDVWLAKKNLSWKLVIGSRSLRELNSNLKTAFESGELIGTSLKKVESKGVSVSVVNRRYKPVEIDELEIVTARKSFFGSKDVRIYYGDGLHLCFRASGSWFGEVSDGMTQHGKISERPINRILKRHGTNTPLLLTSATRLTGSSNFLNEFFPLVDETYERYDPITRDELEDGLIGKGMEWKASKFLGCSLISRIAGAEKEILPRMIEYSTSTGPDCSVHVKIKGIR